MRVIVCGSRSWTDSDRLFDALDALKTEAQAHHSGSSHWHPSMLMLVHGACMQGADMLASQWCESRAVLEERIPAQWGTHGKAAGPIRNREMAAKGADRCLAFWDGRTPGTLDCIGCCVQRGILVLIVPEVRR